MSLRPSELSQVAAELNTALAGAFVQKAHAPREGLCYLELRQVGRTALLCLSVEQATARLSIARDRPAPAPATPPLQRVLRQHLVGARLVAVESAGRQALLHFERAGAALGLRATMDAPGRLQVLRGEKVRLEPVASPEGPSRLSSDGEPLGLARAAEALFVDQADAKDTLDRRRAAMAPLEQKLARLRRTVEKVRAEASRQPLADEHRRTGELLSQNLQLLSRGAKRVVLTEYGSGGPVERETALDPRRSPKDEVAWHFKEYKRLTRGNSLAAARLVTLEREVSELLERIEALRLSDRPVLPGDSAVDYQRIPQVNDGGMAKGHHEYMSSGLRIWVGKHARGNDALTFGVAQPHHIWMHARGVPGSHVVVALEKKATLPQEVLLDAAHLALFHSRSKGEPRGEVAYTRVKNVRRVKGGAPGQVTYTQEKTFLVRIEPARLERLAASVRGV
jgi:predicted ribosome quality control (RQC) complex YloA/Tae2 family protein